jgi:hypothetical protein
MDSVYIAAGCGLSFASLAGIGQAVGADLDWKDLASGGSATMVIIVVVLMLRAQSEMRQEHADVVRKISTDFSETVKANMAMLQQIIQDLRESK